MFNNAMFKWFSIFSLGAPVQASRKLTMVSYSKPAKKYVSIIFFWLSTSQLPWATFRQNLNETCKDFPHVEQNVASKEREELRNRFLFPCQHLGSWGECVVKISKCVAKISKCTCVTKILKCVAKISEL